MGVAATPAPKAKGLGPQNSTKKLAHVGVLLGHLLSQNRVPKLSDPRPTLIFVTLICNISRQKVTLFFSIPLCHV